MESDLVSANPGRSSRGFRVTLWVARIVGVVVLSVMVFMGVGNALNPDEPSPTAAEWVVLAFFPIGVCVGYVLSWRWPLLGGTSDLSGTAGEAGGPMCTETNKEIVRRWMRAALPDLHFTVVLCSRWGSYRGSASGGYMRRGLLQVCVTLAILLALGGAQAFGSSGVSASHSGRVEDATWGGLKVMYRGAAVSSDDMSHARSTESQVRYPIRDTPEHTLAKLVEAYIAMDAEAYIDCLSDTFTFWLNEQDVIDDPTLPWYWEVATETGIHWNMFNDSWIDSIELTLTQYGDAIELPPGVPGRPSAWKYQENYDLWLHMPEAMFFRATEGAEFILAVDPNEVGPSGKELWEISRWEDVESFDTPVEHTSWGAIKALFR